MATTLIGRNGLPVRSSATMAQVIAAQLRGAPKPAGQPAFNVGSVMPVQAPQSVMPTIDNFQVELDNTCSNDLLYIIGDSNGMGAALSNQTWNNPSGSSADGTVKGTGVVPMKRSFGSRPVSVSWWNYQTSSDAAQFTQRVSRVSWDMNGNFNTTPINLFIGLRNNQFEELLITPDVTSQPIIFSEFSGLLVSVLAGETVNMAFNVSMVA